MSSEKRTGRPSSFTPDTGEEICRRISEGESLRSICGSDGFPTKTTVCRWLLRDEPEYARFRDQYARARELQAEHWADEILEISDDTAGDTIADKDGNERTNHEVVARSRLRVDTRKWLMSKLVPKKYGDRIVAEHTGKDGGPIKTESVAPADLARWIAAKLAPTTDEQPQ